VHPFEPHYFTCGDDKTVRKWDVLSCRVVSVADVRTMARALAVSPNGAHLAVGLGGRVGRGKCKGDGGVAILLTEDLSEVKQFKDSNEVSCIHTPKCVSHSRALYSGSAT
jgi:hypothetical protein